MRAQGLVRRYPRSVFNTHETAQQTLDGLPAPVADTDKIILGSAIRALGVRPAFHRYLFNDVKRSNVETLKKAVREDFDHLKDRVEITQLDANKMLRDLCSSQNWRETRAVVFLDPFGLQIDSIGVEADRRGLWGSPLQQLPHLAIQLSQGPHQHAAHHRDVSTHHPKSVCTWQKRARDTKDRPPRFVLAIEKGRRYCLVRKSRQGADRCGIRRSRFEGDVAARSKWCSGIFADVCLGEPK